MSYFKITFSLFLFLFSCVNKKDQKLQEEQPSNPVEVAIEINQKFQRLDSSLKQFTDSSHARSEKILAEITRKVQERGNDSAETKALAKARAMHELSQATIDYIEKLKTEIEEDSTIIKSKGKELDSVLTNFTTEIKSYQIDSLQ